MVDEEAAGVVDARLVEVGFHRLAHAEPERGFGDEAGECLVLLTSADPNIIGIDLKGSADAAIPHFRRSGVEPKSTLFGLVVVLATTVFLRGEIRLY
jgi:hypothetical protein